MLVYAPFEAVGVRAEISTYLKSSLPLRKTPDGSDPSISILLLTLETNSFFTPACAPTAIIWSTVRVFSLASPASSLNIGFHSLPSSGRWWKWKLWKPPFAVGKCSSRRGRRAF